MWPDMCPRLHTLLDLVSSGITATRAPAGSEGSPGAAPRGWSAGAGGCRDVEPCPSQRSGKHRLPTVGGLRHTGSAPAGLANITVAGRCRLDIRLPLSPFRSNLCSHVAKF